MRRELAAVKLKGKIAVIYGGGGAIGGAVARAFGAEGARLFLAGRHLAPLETVAGDVVAAGGSIEVAEVDALDERAVDGHLETVVDRGAGSTSRSTRSASRARGSARRSSMSTWSSSRCRSRPTPRRTS
jgi:NAD(P)-dependent dehydrogenase (short-subunit alcohol dehydrogenase family)